MKTNRFIKSIASLTLVIAMVAAIMFPYVTANAAPPKKVKITAPKKDVSISGTLKLTANFTPKNATAKVTWTSSKKAVATVDAIGNVKGKKAGTTTITAKTDNGKSAKFKVKVTAVAKVAPGTVLWDQSKEKDKAKREVLSLYNEYKYDVSSIWLCPFNLYYQGGDKDVGEAVNHLGRTLRFQGQFQMVGGPPAEELLIQLNYTQPKAYPIVWQTNKDKEKVEPGKWKKFNFTFTLPKNAVNGDKDSETGLNWPILLYIANKPNNTMIYQPGNDFKIKNCKLTVVK